MTNVTFTDAQAMAAEHPDTFEAPYLDELRIDVKPGDWLKVCVNNMERLWTRVLHLDGDSVVAEVDNHPVFVPLELGEQVEYELRHVYCHMPEVVCDEQEVV